MPSKNSDFSLAPLYRNHFPEGINFTNNSFFYDKPYFLLAVNIPILCGGKHDILVRLEVTVCYVKFFTIIVVILGMG